MTRFQSANTNDSNDDDSTSTGHHSNDNTQRKIIHYKRLLLLFTALYTTFFAGAPYGWGPMQLLLIDNETFSCNNGEEECLDQISKLLNLNFIANMIAMIATPLMGQYCDVYGPKALLILMTSFVTGGLSLFTISLFVPRMDNALYGVFVLLFMTSYSTSILIIHTGILLESTTNNESKKRKIISFLNALFDGGSITYMLLWKIKSIFGIQELSTIIIGYLALAMVCFGGSIIVWTLLASSVSVLVDTTASVSQSIHSMSTIHQYNTTQQQQEKEQHDNSSTINNQNETNQQLLESTCATEYILIKNRSAWQQLKSKQFQMITLFYSLHLTRNGFILTSAQNFLYDLGDADGTYLTIFTSLLPISILGVPLINYSISTHGYHWGGFQLVNGLGVVHGLIQILFRKLNVQIVGFVVYSIYRCCLFSVIFTFLPLTLSERVVGKAYGIMQVVAGAIAYINIPMGGTFAIHYCNGNFFYPNLLYTVIILPLVGIAFNIGVIIKKEEQETEKVMLRRSNNATRASCVSSVSNLKEKDEFQIQHED